MPFKLKKNIEQQTIIVHFWLLHKNKYYISFDTEPLLYSLILSIIWHRRYISIRIILSYKAKIQHGAVSHLTYSFILILLKQREKRRWHKTQHTSKCRILEQQPTERKLSRRIIGSINSSNIKKKQKTAEITRETKRHEPIGSQIRIK